MRPEAVPPFVSAHPIWVGDPTVERILVISSTGFGGTLLKPLGIGQV